MSLTVSGGIGGGPSATISPTSIRALSDRSYEKRKAGAIEIEGIVKALLAEEKRANSGSATEGLSKIVKILANDFIIHQNANKRKGGLIGLAAVAIGMGPELPRVLPLILPPVIKCIDDPDARVRYYATESIYNILKVARSKIFPYFNAVFDVLCKLFADVDAEVVHGAQVLDRLLKDLVGESEGFEVDAFLPLLQKYLKMTNPYIRQLLVGWIIALDAVPDIDMVKRLPDFLDGLFNMLSDGNKEIRQAADSALTEFLQEIKENKRVAVVPSCVSILVTQCFSAQSFNRLTALTWILEFIFLCQDDQLVPCIADLLGAIMHCISDDEEEEIQRVAAKCNKELHGIVQKTEKNFNEAPIVLIAKDQKNQTARLTGLDWLSMLLDKVPSQMNAHIDNLMPTLLASLSDPVDQVVLMTLGVLGRIARNSNLTDRILTSIVNLFERDREILENRGAIIIRQLSVLLRPSTVYLILAGIVEKNTRDLQFANVMVQTLNILLLTAVELGELRNSLKRLSVRSDSVDRKLFVAIYRAWCHSPVAALSLCLYSQQYSIASKLVMESSEFEISVDMLLSLDRLVQLLESPIFLHLRMKLLQSGDSFQPELLQCLNGILMLLPQQSTAFKTLKYRLQAVTSMHLVLIRASSLPIKAPSISENDDVDDQQSNEDVENNNKNDNHDDDDKFETELVAHFTKIQNLHGEQKEKVIKERSLLR